MPTVLVDVAAAATTDLVAAPTVAGQFIRVQGYHLSCPAAQEVTMTGGTAKDGASFGSTGGAVEVFPTTEFAFDCDANSKLSITTGTAARLRGNFSYTIRGPVPTS